MSDEITPAPQPIEGGPPPETDVTRPGAVLSARGTMRALLILLAIWSLFSGLALVFFQSAAAATIGGGIEGGEGEAAQRLLGVHLLVLGPIYGLLAWEPERYRWLLWVPYVAQGGVVLATAFDIITGARDFTDGVLPLIVASVFLALLVYVWAVRRVPEPAEQPAQAEGQAADAPREGAPDPPEAS